MCMQRAYLLHTVALVLLTLVVGTGVALAHADLISSNPAAGARLAAAPATITLVFSEELKPEGNLVTVTDASGAQVGAGDTALDLNDPGRVSLTVSLKPGLGDGVYTVNWTNASTDGHAETGSFTFTVGAAAAAAPGLPATGAATAIPATGLLALAAAALVLGLSLRRLSH
ncbi:MAG: copper resistance protein CopC [Chloroflexi bacterium]|nr:copper resistance protein CopC [Chloroflexota bacterium]